MDEEIINFLLSLSYDVLITVLKSYSHQDKMELLQNEKFLNKLFLLDIDENIWNFERITEVYTFSELLPYFHGALLNAMDNRADYRSYVYLLPFVRNNKEEMNTMFTNEEFLNFFLKHASNIYSELNFDSNFVLQLFNYATSKEIYLDNSLFCGLVNYSLDTVEKQKMVLESIKDNDLIVRILFLIDKEVAQNYLKDHVVGLSDSEVFYLMTIMTVPLTYFENSSFFRNCILDSNINKMNQKNMELSQNNNVTYLENMKDNLLNKVLSLYNEETDTLPFPEDDYIDFNKTELSSIFLHLWQIRYGNLSKQDLTHKIIGHIVLEKLFQENYRDLLMDIGEMLTFNAKASPSILNEEEIKLYEQVINFNEMNTSQILDFYEQNKNKDLKTLFYDNMRQVKNVSYQNLQDSCLKIDNMANLKNNVESEKHGVDIYELKGENFISLISCQRPQVGEYAHQVRKCYSLISQDNLSVFNEHAVIYGFSNFPIENIIHVFEWDEGSSDTLDKENLEYINRIRTPEEILSSNTMNEIQIANNYDAENGHYLRIKPDYIVCFDEINIYTIMRAKEENLPIVVIDRKYYQNLDKSKTYEKLSPREYYYSPYSNDVFDEYNGKKL